MCKCISDIKTIQQFINLTDGDWRKSIYIECKICKYEPCEWCGDFLCVPNEKGELIMLPISDCKILFGCYIDPSECLLRVSHYRFRELYGALFKNKQHAQDKCPFII